MVENGDKFFKETCFDMEGDETQRQETNAQSWAELEKQTIPAPDYTNGPTRSQSRLRLFGQDESTVRVVLYRDHHAWCPYCQKVWLWLEEKQVPYRIEKVTMFCYGEKEAWFKKIVPNGMLPALTIDGKMITDSDQILQKLEQVFGVLHKGIGYQDVFPLRQLERQLFRKWCEWLCRPHKTVQLDDQSGAQFDQIAGVVNQALNATEGPYFLEEFSTADVIFTPYIERMAASLYYYKGYNIKTKHTAIGNWFKAMETRPTYVGTQSSYHTHAHDLPPQMGGCYSNNSQQALENASRVDQGPWENVPEFDHQAPETSRQEALSACLRHRQRIIFVNPDSDSARFEAAMRCSLTNLMQPKIVCTPPQGSAAGLRYMCDRISVPRDMSIHAAVMLRTALERTACLDSKSQGPDITTQHRRDQNPANFQKKR